MWNWNPIAFARAALVRVRTCLGADEHRGTTTTIGRVLAAAALLLLAAAATSGWHSNHHGQLAEGYVRGAFLAVAAIFGLVAVVLVPRTRLEEPTGEPIFQPDEGWIAGLQEEATKRRFASDAGAVISFLELVTNPASCRSRVVETIDLDGHAVQQRVTVEFVLPDEALKSEALYLPILQPLKGELVDNFHLTDGSDNTLTNLSFEETTQLATVGLRALVLHATYLNDASSADISTLSPEVVETERALLKLIARRGLIEPVEVANKIETELKSLGWLNESPIKDLIRSYLVSLGVAYPIVVAVPSGLVVGDRILLRYERTLSLSSETRGTQGKARLFLGLQPRQVSIPVNLALTAGSYHLRINAPTAMYLYEQHLRCSRCTARLQRAWRGDTGKNGCYHRDVSLPPDDCHYHLRRRRGQNYLHLYMRGYGNSRPLLQNLEVFARFKEIPPGTRGTAVATALAETIFIWVVGYLISRNKAILTDLPVFLLGLPAVMASWWGFTSDSGSVVGPSLIARVSLLVSGLISLGAVVTYLLEVPVAGHGGSSPTGSHLAFAGVTAPVWVILLVSSVSNLGYILWRLVRKAYFYGRLVRRLGPVGGLPQPMTGERDADVRISK
jgi:hypothetical protein